jgi:serine/threonine protein kinase
MPAERDAMYVDQDDNVAALLSPSGSVRSNSSARCRGAPLSAHQEEAVSTEDKASGAVTPDMTFEKNVPPPSPSSSWVAAYNASAVCSLDLTDAKDTRPASAIFSSPISPKRVPMSPDLVSRRRKGWTQKRSTSFSNVCDHLKQPAAGLPASPELCGLQAILPRRCGLSVQKKIGEGSFGKVVLAINNSNHSGAGAGLLGKSSRIIHKLPKTGVQVVLKCIKKPNDQDNMPMPGGESECLAREVLIHGRVDHINMPRMYGYYEDQQNLTMILDLIPGQELRQVLAIRRTMPEHEAKLVCLQVARGLEYLHCMNVVHRDVSPRNILLGDGNKAWLIDLGLAVDLEAQDVGSIQTAGTMGYMPPESRDGSHTLSTAWDMWALGTILYETLFGFSPFLPHELHMPTAMVQFPDPDWGLDASDQVKEVLNALLSKDRRLRMPSAALLTHKWASAEVLETLDCMFAAESAERASEEMQQQQEQLLAVDLLGGKYLGHKTATLLPRTRSNDDEISDAMVDDGDCQSLNTLWNAVAWSSSMRWASSDSTPAHKSPMLSPNYTPAPAVPTTLSSLATLRRSISDSDLATSPVIP